MHFAQPVKDKIAHVIGTYFSTKEIESIFGDANIQTNNSLFAKWKITLDAFSKMSSPEEAIPHILENFAHPLRFQDPETRKRFIDDLNKALVYAKLEMRSTDKGAEVLDEQGFPATLPDFEPPPYKTPADYVKEVIKFFKDEYNKVRIAGLTYEYCIGEAAGIDGSYTDTYLGHQKAVEQLKRIGFITELEYEQQMSDDNDVYDYAMCKIDESKLTQEEPKATAAGAEAIAQKVIHEHTHRFDGDSSAAFKMEITKVPELQVRNVEDATITKGKKRVHLPHFNPTDWAKITIRFIDEQNVIVTADKKQVPSDYEALGFADDKRGKPNTAWAFLLGLARHNGETQPLPTPIPDTIKQHKRQLSDRLKTIFKNDTDPFHPSAGERTYKIKLTLIPPQSESAVRSTEYLTEEIE